MTDLITAEEAKKLAEDCRLAAKVLADTHTFPTGQAVLAEAARSVIALHAQLAEAVEAERERQEARFADLLGAAHGLSYGEDWNNGTHAKTHGYREKLLAAVADLMGDMASQQATAIRAALATQEAGI